jgi:hypothetical protein
MVQDYARELGALRAEPLQSQLSHGPHLCGTTTRGPHSDDFWGTITTRCSLVQRRQMQSRRDRQGYGTGRF